jgi:hypothetical protein
MKRILMIIPLLAFLTFGCMFYETLVGSGDLVEVQMGYTGFTSLDVDAPFEVTVIHDNDYSVTVMVDDNILDLVEVSQTGQTLSLDLSPQFGYGNMTLKAVVAMPILDGVKMSSASTVTVIDSASFPSVASTSIDVSEASHLLISSVVTNELTVSVTGASRATIGALASGTTLIVEDASTVKMNGSSYDLTMTSAAASKADLTDYETTDASTTVSGASEAWVNVNGSLDVDVSGASSLYYHGAASIGYFNMTGASSFITY